MVVSEWSCCWCEKEDAFTGADDSEVEEQARESGWFCLMNDEGEFEFCSTECLISYL